MSPSPDPAPPGTPWMPNRPAVQSAGPPGLAALLDAERSVLRELHARLRALAEAEHAATLRAIALDDAVKSQHAARRQSRGMRDRMRARELDRRLLTADARSTAAAAASAAEAARLRVLATERRLAEIREIVDARAGDRRSEVDPLRRSAELPASARAFPTIAAFIAADARRAVGDPRQQDLVGIPLGDRWQLEEPGQPWLATRWRALWNADGAEATGELFAVERALRPHAARRVFLLGNVPRSDETSARIERALAWQPERNSLAALAELAGS